MMLALVLATQDLRSHRTLASDQPRYCIVPATVHVTEGADCASLGAAASTSAELDLMIGEAEHFQVLVEGHDGQVGKMALEFPQLPLHDGSGTGAPEVEFRWHQLG